MNHSYLFDQVENAMIIHLARKKHQKPQEYLKQLIKETYEKHR